MSIINQFYSALSQKADLKELVTEDVQLHVSHPINDLVGAEPIETKYWNVLQQAMPDIERKAFIEFDSEYQGDTWVAATGYFVGTFINPLLDIPASGKGLYLRFTELVKLNEGKIADYFIILDFLDVMNQVGVNPLRKSLGHDGLIMPPSTMDGLNPVSCLLYTSPSPRDA